MASNVVLWFAVGIILLTTAAMMVSRDWRASLGALGLQYFAMLWLVIQHLPFVMGAAKLIAGWMVVAVLGMTRMGLVTVDEGSDDLRGSQPFRAALMAVVAFVVAGAAARIEAAIPGLGLQVVAGGLLLIGGGIIHLGVTTDLFHTILGLLTMLAGFEVLYAAVESSVLVVGILAVVNLSLALAGSYLLVAGTVDHEEEGEDLL
jgi:hypothetical protein